jgi:hypothetical protein
MSMKTLVIRRGARLVIRAVAYPSEDPKWDKCPVLEFFQQQAKEHPKEMTKLGALLSESAKSGPPQNDTKFKDLPGTDGLYEFKTAGGLRLICFWDAGSLIVCTHGYVKGSQKAPKSEINRAERIKKEYFDAKKKGDLTHAQERG